MWKHLSIMCIPSCAAHALPHVHDPVPGQSAAARPLDRLVLPDVSECSRSLEEENKSSEIMQNLSANVGLERTNMSRTKADTIQEMKFTVKLLDIQ